MKASNSRIQCFKSCRRLYELKYIYGLEPIKQSDAIQRGLAYHEAVEKILSGEQPTFDDPKIAAMVTAFQKYIKLDIDAVEEWFAYNTPSGHTVVGRIDGRTKNGSIVEHKTTSSAIDGQYFLRLDMDEQIPTYMLSQNTNSIYYTVCQTPSIRQRKGETELEFYSRCVDWYDDSKIVCVPMFRSDKQLFAFMAEQDAVLNEMENCKVFYRNPNHCMKYGRLCEYAPICMNYNPSEEYVQFRKREE